MTETAVLAFELPVYDASGFRDDVPAVVAAIRAGIAAWECRPTANAVEKAVNPAFFERSREIAAALEDLHRIEVEKLQKRWKTAKKARKSALK